MQSTPPSSSGPGRSPLKAQTGVRVPLGAQKNPSEKGGIFLCVEFQNRVYKS